MYTILERAIKDILKKEEDHYYDAFAWFFGIENYGQPEWLSYFYSMESICMHLHIDVQYLRKKMMLLVEI